MATSQQFVTEYPIASSNRFLTWSWAGIFAGTFVYLAIESTFGLLGTAIFSTASGSGAAAPATAGMSTGLQIWMVVLSIIAMYFAGKTSSKLLRGNADRNLGMYHGFVTFGLSIVSTILLVALASVGSTVVYTGAVAGTRAAAMNTIGLISSSGEWWLFVAFVLSMIAAASGGMHGVRSAELAGNKTVTTKRAA